MEEIAEQINTTAGTVKYHNRETYRRLGVSGKAAAVNEEKLRLDLRNCLAGNGI